MPQKKILIIEDNDLNMKLVRTVLRDHYEIAGADTAEQGIEIAREWLPDLVLMDIQLPGMDGLAATRIIKGDPRTNGLKIVALTAFALEGDEKKARDAGCIGYLTKPINTRSLLPAISTYISQAEEP
jgi:CheY-like chemotaxis protein